MGFFDFFKATAAPAQATKQTTTLTGARASYSVDAGFTNPTAQNKALYQLYCSNPWVSSSVDTIANALSKGFRIKSTSDDVTDAKQIEDFLNHPNPSDSYETLINKLVRSLLIFGVAFCEVQRIGLDAEQVRPAIEKALSAYESLIPNFTDEVEDTVQLAISNGIPKYMRVIPTWQIEVLTDKQGHITGYKQHTDNGKTIDFSVSEILHIVHPMSFDPKYGNSPLEAISKTAVIDTLIRERDKQILKNTSAIADIYTLKDASKESVERLQEEMLRSYKGVSASGNFLVTSADLEHTSIAHDNEGDYLKLRDINKVEITAKLGVPLSMVENAGTGLNGAGSIQQYRSFMENTVQPLARHIEGIFNIQLIEPFEAVGITDVVMEIDLAFGQDESLNETMWDMMVKNGTLTPNEVRVLRGQDPYRGMGDEPFIDAKDVFALRDVGKLAPPSADEAVAKAQAISELRALARELRKKLG